MDSLIHFKGRNLKQILIYYGWVPVINALFYPLKNSILVWERWLQRNPNIIEGKGGGGGNRWYTGISLLPTSKPSEDGQLARRPA